MSIAYEYAFYDNFDNKVFVLVKYRGAKFESKFFKMDESGMWFIGNAHGAACFKDPNLTYLGVI